MVTNAYWNEFPARYMIDKFINLAINMSVERNYFHHVGFHFVNRFIMHVSGEMKKNLKEKNEKKRNEKNDKKKRKKGLVFSFVVVFFLFNFFLSKFAMGNWTPENIMTTFRLPLAQKLTASSAAYTLLFDIYINGFQYVQTNNPTFLLKGEVKEEEKKKKE